MGLCFVTTVWSKIVVASLSLAFKTYLENFLFWWSRQFWWFNTSGFWVILKITYYICQFMQANPQRQNYSIFIWPFESGKWKEREKITKNWRSKEQKELFRWSKKHFSYLLKSFLLVNYSKIEDTSLNNSTKIVLEIQKVTGISKSCSSCFSQMN